MRRSSIFDNAPQKIDTIMNVAGGVTSLYDKSKEFWRKHFAYTIVISEKDSLYSDVHAWLISALPHEKHRSLAISSARGARNDPYETSSDDDRAYRPNPLIVRFNDTISRTIQVEGHPIVISLRMPDGAVAEKTYLTKEPDYAKIHFEARSYQAQQAVVRQLEKLNSQRTTSRKAVLKMMNQWGSWSTRSDLPPRTMESVALSGDQKARISNDLKDFLESEEKYNRLAIPWHRGYMFYGPPGTGKTSLVKALANEFNLDLWYVSLSDLGKETSLMSLLADVGPRSLLLLEDIDTLRITHDRDNSTPGVISMSSLLNTLDGVGTPHGLITIMTTNRFDILDPALTRAGRMDMVEEIDYPTLNTLGEMFKHFYGTIPRWLVPMQEDAPIEGLSTSSISEIMKRNMSDPDTAFREINKVLELRMQLTD